MGTNHRAGRGRRASASTLFALCAAAAALTGCGSSKGFVSRTPDAQLAEARDSVARHKWNRAVSQLSALSGTTLGRPEFPEVKYRLGLAYAGLKDYPASEKELSVVVREYPASDFADDAQLAIAEGFAAQIRSSQLDQTVTWQALDKIREFFRRFPDSDLAPRGREILARVRTQLARKEYDNGRLYLRLGDGPAARTYFEGILRDYADTPLATAAQFGVGESYRKENRFDEAIAAYRAVLDANAEAELVRKSGERIRELESRKGRS